MTAGGFDRRTFLQAALAGLLLPACKDSNRSKAGPSKNPASGKSPATKNLKNTAGRLVILGFDGVDPRLVQRWISSGDLPNMAKLSRDGYFSPLGSTSPPNSPVAWTTFATGKDPSEHGVFGFIKRDPRTYLPGTAPYSITGPRFHGGSVDQPTARSNRIGDAWWDTLDRAGVSVGMLFVPYAFPAPDLHHGRVFAGLGVPDARFTNSSFTLYTSEPRQPGTSDRVAGGRIIRLSVTSSSIDTTIDGPRGPDKKPLNLALHLELNRKNGIIKISSGGKTQLVAEGQRSDWFPVKFSAPGFELVGRVRFHVLSVKKELRLYASPIQIDPGQDFLPLGGPRDWLIRAVEKHQLPTVGWVHDTSAVNAGVLPKTVFLGAVLDTMRTRASLLMEELENHATRVQMGVFTGTDRAAHIFYKELQRDDGGPLKLVYKEMDRIIGQAQRRLKPEDRLVVMSDHGFHPFDRMLHVNTWLEQQNLFRRSKPGGAVRFLRGVDWSQTKAYSLGNGQVYVNLKGRESAGSVHAGPQQKMILAQIKRRLLELKDPASGTKLVSQVYPVSNLTKGQLQSIAPDLQIAFSPGWRSSWETSLGGAPLGDAMAKNPKAWCGDHAASDIKDTPGIIMLGNKPMQSDPNLKDLSSTIKAFFKLDPGGPGRPFWS